MLRGRKEHLGRKGNSAWERPLSLSCTQRTRVWDRNAVSSGSQASSPGGGGEAVLKEVERWSLVMQSGALWGEH